jgi:hypothetical protein
MIVFTPSSIGEVGDTAKNSYFFNPRPGVARRGVGEDGMVHAATGLSKNG